MCMVFKANAVERPPDQPPFPRSVSAGTWLRGTRALWFSAIACLVGCSSDPEPLNDAGTARMGRYEYADAVRLFAKAVEAAPDWPVARVNLAIATLNRQQEADEQRALEILADVLADEPDNVRAVYTTAILRLYLGDAASAEVGFRRVTELDPQDAYSAYFLGQSLLQQGDYAGAAPWFERSIELDPYLRSAYWAGSQALRRLGRQDGANALFADYQRLESNPASRLAGFSYKEMGPKASAVAATRHALTPIPRPAGPLFGEPQTLFADRTRDVVAADANGDGIIDLVLVTPNGTRMLEGVAGGFGSRALPLFPSTSQTSAAPTLWGDLDNDGLTDAVGCGANGTHLWRQHPAAKWSPMPLPKTLPCAAGTLVDADHDGDLDILVTGARGTELFNNNRDGSFTALASELGLGKGHGRQVLATDLDNDRDIDIVVLNRMPPHDIWRNDRTWRYQRFAGLDGLRHADLAAIAAVDTDGDGAREIYAIGSAGELLRWRFDGIVWGAPEVLAAGTGLERNAVLDVADFDGDGRFEVVRALPNRVDIIEASTGNLVHTQPAADLTSALAVNADPAVGPVLAIVDARGVTLLPAGPGRHGFVFVSPKGRNENEQMRSNASGIGAQVKLRHGGRWSVLDAIDPNSGPGQSLQPLAFGLGGRPSADFVALDWSDGVSQTELALSAGLTHSIVEVERQLASCPVLFAWNGRAFEFVSDVLGGAALGFLEAPASYAPARPMESFLLGAEDLVARDGRYLLKLAEPMEEAVYLDFAQLTVFDLPPGWHMVLDERLAVGGPPATGRPIYYRRSIRPYRVTDALGADITTLATEKDQRAPSPGELDRRFIGLLAEEQVLTLEFDKPLPPKGAVLIADGWIEYPYSQTTFAAWQAGLRYRPVTVEARVKGAWRVVADKFGYPAGMPRTMALPLHDLPPGTDALRLASNMEIYWDRLQVAWEEPLEPPTNTLKPVAARVARSGFARRTTGSQRRPDYDYANRSPYWDAKTPSGAYTAFGNAGALVDRRDGALAIFGSGEEVHLEFAETPPIPGHRRFYAIEFHGWAKDMDLYTLDGHRLDPLPVPADATDALLARREALHERFNVRFRGGPVQN